MEAVLAHFFLAQSKGTSSPQLSAAASWFRCARCWESPRRRRQCQRVKSPQRVNLDSLNEVRCWIFCSLFLLDCGGCWSNIDRGGRGSGRGSGRGCGTGNGTGCGTGSSCHGCADTWLCLHWGSRKTQRPHVRELIFDFRLSYEFVLGSDKQFSGQCGPKGRAREGVGCGGWTPLTLCQRQGKGGGRLAGRTCGGSSSSCSRGGGWGGGGSTGDWAFRHNYTHTHTKWIKDLVDAKWEEQNPTEGKESRFLTFVILCRSFPNQKHKVLLACINLWGMKQSTATRVLTVQWPIKLTFPYWHEYGLQASRPTPNPQLFELVSGNG